MPRDPRHQLIAEAHVYGGNTCDDVACFQATYAPVARRVPLIFGEIGERFDNSDCGTSHISTIVDWADAHRVGYEAWAWDTWGSCGILIRNYAARRTVGMARGSVLTTSAGDRDSSPHVRWICVRLVPCRGRDPA